MESVAVITLAELLKRSRPCTAAASLQSSSSTRPIHRMDPSPASADYESEEPGECEKESNFKTLEVLDSPSVLIGSVVLPGDENLFSCRCPSGGNCLVFVDGEASVCCDILDFDVGIVRRRIRVLAWNYIPFKVKGGFLEIINWEFLDKSNDWMRPCSGERSLQINVRSSVDGVGDLKARYFAHGFVESVSPVVVVPRTESKNEDGATFVRGFLVRIMSCECMVCKSKDSEAVVCAVSIEKSGHCYEKCVTVYFCGSAAGVHPVMSKLVGRFVFMTILRKKMVFVGKLEGQLMYVTTEKSRITVLKLLNKKPVEKNGTLKGKGESGVYNGIIKGIYMQGMILEMDNDVWLLFTDNSASLPHSLRVGALISVINVHFVKCKISCNVMLLLGGCIETTTNVQCFSPLAASCCTSPRSQSLLGKFIDSLAFAARLWVLLTVTCLRKKFAGILTEKEILGSKHSKGLAHAYAVSNLPPLPVQLQRGAFMEFCQHESLECSGTSNYEHLKLVLPLSVFIQQFGCIPSSKFEKFPVPSYDRYHDQPLRKIVSSEDIGSVLVGRLQISTSTGRLQLADATGSINIVIPDMSTNMDDKKIYEVNRYNLVIEDLPMRVGRSAVMRTTLLSCKSCLPREAAMTTYIHCYMENLTCISDLIIPSNDPVNDLNKVSCGIFHVLRLTHKFPMLQNGDPALSQKQSVFAEAVVLPWKLSLPPNHIDLNPSGVYEETHAEIIKNLEFSDYGHFHNKKRKCRYAAEKELHSSYEDLEGTGLEAAGLVKFSIVPCRKRGMQQVSESRSPIQLPCSTIIRSGEKCNRVLSGFLCCTESDILKEAVGSTANAPKVLLEFKSDNLMKYQALRIGSYYIIKHESDMSLNKFEGFKDNSITKVVITLSWQIWSLVLIYDDGSLASSDAPLAESFNDVGITSAKGDCQTLLQYQGSNVGCHVSYSDVEVHLSCKFRKIVEGNSRCPEETSSKSIVASNEISCSLALGSSCPLPVGKLISFYGHVVAVSSSDQKSVTDTCSLEWAGRFSHQGSSNCLWIRILMNNGTVRLVKCPGYNSFPTGFGAGVDAHFHRVLHSGTDEYLIIPVSCVVITSIKAVTEHISDEHLRMSLPLKTLRTSIPDRFTSGLIYHMMHSSELETIQIRCRVLAVHLLVFDKNDKNKKGLHCNLVDQPDIPLAGFILDDGSSTCCCWANTDRAAAFLRMHEQVPSYGVSCSYWSGSRTRYSTVSHHLNKILKKHSRITVKNYGSPFELASPDLIISVNSSEFLDISDEEIVKCIVLNACVGSTVNVLGNVMDSVAVEHLHKHVAEMEMTIPSMQNIWAKEVLYTNPLDEARNLMQDVM